MVARQSKLPAARAGFAQRQPVSRVGFQHAIAIGGVDGLRRTALDDLRTEVLNERARPAIEIPPQEHSRAAD